MALTKILSIPPIVALEYVERLSTIAERHGMTLQEVEEFVAKIAEHERGTTFLNIPPPSGEIPPVPISGHASFGCVSAPFFANDRQAEAAQIARGLDRSLQAIHALTAMCRQWLTKPETPRLLDHSFISACEFAIDVLMDLGICAEGDKGFYLVDPPPTDQEIIDRLTAP